MKSTRFLFVPSVLTLEPVNPLAPELLFF